MVILSPVSRLTLAALLLGAVGCGSRSQKEAATPAAGPPMCRNDAGDTVEVGARTGVEGARTGVTTAVEGVKTFGSATAGLVQGGTDEAKARWKEGAAQTKEAARAGGAETKQEADVPRCK
jgi:hypothetical protein